MYLINLKINAISKFTYHPTLIHKVKKNNFEQWSYTNHLLPWIWINLACPSSLNNFYTNIYMLVVKKKKKILSTRYLYTKTNEPDSIVQYILTDLSKRFEYKIRLTL